MPSPPPVGQDAGREEEEEPRSEAPGGKGGLHPAIGRAGDVVPGRGRGREGLPAGVGSGEEEPSGQFGPVQGLALEAACYMCQPFLTGVPAGFLLPPPPVLGQGLTVSLAHQPAPAASCRSPEVTVGRPLEGQGEAWVQWGVMMGCQYWGPWYTSLPCGLRRRLGVRARWWLSWTTHLWSIVLRPHL